MTDSGRRLSPLRCRMVEDMTVRNLSPATQRSYLQAVAKFSRHFGRSPDRLDLEDVHAYHVYLVSQGISWPALNQTVCALRFFYGVTLNRPDLPIGDQTSLLTVNLIEFCEFIFCLTLALSIWMPCRGEPRILCSSSMTSGSIS